MTKTYWFIFMADRLLLDVGNTIPLSDSMPVISADGMVTLNLPNLNSHPCRAVQATDVDTPPGHKWLDLRSSFDVLPRPLYAMAGKAREMLHWNDCTRHCGHCGAPMVLNTNISKRCTACGREVWTWLSTAIIVAITREDTNEILLVQSNKFRGDYLGLVAGFVETGETLEECVHREVMEETGLTIKDLTYVASQAWPYPRGLMVGFRAHYAGGNLHLQHSELNKGGWYGRHNMPAIPGEVSLARRLIDRWIAEAPA